MKTHAVGETIYTTVNKGKKIKIRDIEIYSDYTEEYKDKEYSDIKMVTNSKNNERVFLAEVGAYIKHKGVKLSFYGYYEAQIYPIYNDKGELVEIQFTSHP